MLAPTTLLRRAGVRHLLRHPAQLGLAFAGLTLGVASVVAVAVATRSAQRAFEISLTGVTGSATHQIEGGPAGIDERLYLQLRRSGVALALAPEVTGYVEVGGRALRLAGIDPFAARELDTGGAAAATADPGTDDMDSARRWFMTPGSVVLSAQAARQLRLAPGQRFALSIGGVVRQAFLGGLAGPGAPGADDVVFTDIAQAQEWLGMLGRLSRIDVRLPGGAAGEAALRALRARLPAAVTVVGTRASAAETLAMTDAFTTNLRAMSLLALLVGALLIYSAVSFLVLQRRATFGVLRALGATRAQLLRGVLLEAGLLGVVGAVCGVVGGLLLARTLVRLVAQTLNDLYFRLTVTELHAPMGWLAVAAILGVTVSLLACLAPALEAAGQSPRLSLARSVLEARATGLARAGVWVGMACAATAGVLVTLPGRSLLVGFVALFLLLAAVATWTPAALQALARWVARALGSVSPLARLAASSVGASLSRTGVAVAALGMALTAMIGVAIMVASFRESLRQWLEQTLRADVYVSAPGPADAAQRRLDPQVMSALLAVPGVVAHTEGRRVTVASERGPVELNALALLPGSRAGFRLTAGEEHEAWTGFERGAILVSEPLAWRLQLHPGGDLQLLTDRGPRRFTVAGVYREYGNDRGEALLDLSRYRQLWDDTGVSGLGIYVNRAADVPRVIDNLRSAAGGRQVLLIRSNAAIRTLSMTVFDRTFTITRVLYWLAAAVAALGLVSALLAWQLERRREAALLRTLGLAPRAAAAVVLAQTAFMAFAALLAAIPAGLLTAVVLTEVINRRAFGWQIDLHLAARHFGDPVLLAFAAAAAAAAYPAWRSSRAPLAADLRAE